MIRSRSCRCSGRHDYYCRSGYAAHTLDIFAIWRLARVLQRAYHDGLRDRVRVYAPTIAQRLVAYTGARHALAPFLAIILPPRISRMTARREAEFTCPGSSPTLRICNGHEFGRRSWFCALLHNRDANLLLFGCLSNIPSFSPSTPYRLSTLERRCFT